MPSQTATMPAFYIPTIDIAPYLSDPSSIESLKIINQVREACISTGFFQYIHPSYQPPLPIILTTRQNHKPRHLSHTPRRRLQRLSGLLCAPDGREKEAG